VYADLRTPPPNPQHEMGARVDGGKAPHPDVLKNAEDGELPLLVDQGVIGDDRKVDLQLR